MKKMFLSVVAGVVLSVPVVAQNRDAKADAVGHEFISALGGETAWAKARQFRFDFAVEREGKSVARFSHAWDRYTGDYRLSGTDKTGAPFTVFFNVNTREGQAFVNGKAVEGEAREAQLKNAYGRFINDTFWLLAPWKIFDPGVRLAYDGEKPCPAETGAGACDVLKMSFDNVGLTPRDIYWLWITRDGGHMVAWQYLLNGAEETPTLALWKDWKNYGGILLASEKPMAGKPAAIRFENLSVTSTRDDALFRPESQTR